MQTEALRKLFTVDEYHRMAEAGIFTPADRVELVGGEIIQVTAMGARHAAAVRRASALLTLRLHRRAVVGVQLPVLLGPSSEPEPDISVARLREDCYAAGHPRPEDLLLLVEIAETSLAYDSEVKLPVYAAARVREVWIEDLQADVMRVCRDPFERRYRTSRTVGRGGSLSPEAFPDLQFSVDDFLG